MNLSDDWDRHFIANFEENIFALNELDEHILDEILKSPQGKAMLSSPQGKVLLNSPQGQAILERQRNEQTLSLSQTAVSASLTANTVTYLASSVSNILSPCDPNKMSATPVKQTAKTALKLSKRKLTMSQSIPVLSGPTPKIPILPKENVGPGGWPAKGVSEPITFWHCGWSGSLWDQDPYCPAHGHP